MKHGKLLSAGPFEDQAGGIPICRLTDPKWVDAVAANKEGSYSPRRWEMRRLAPEQ